MTVTTTSPGLRRQDLVALGLVASLVSINSTMIAVALPDIADDFGIGKGTAGLLITAYLAVMLVGQPVAGRVSDLVDAQRLIIGALLGFAGAAVLGAVATSFGLLVLARAGQALCAVVFVPGTQALVRRLVRPSRRGHAFGIHSAFLAVGAALGPVLGGAVTVAVGWEGVFLVNLPIVAVALVLLVAMPRPPAVVAPTRETTVSIRTLWTAAFSASFLAQATSVFGQYSLLLAVPIVLDARGWGAGAIGAALTALTIGMTVTGPLGGRYGDRHGRRRPVMLGTTTASAGVIGAALAIGDSPPLLIASLVLFGIGLGFALPNITTSALESVPEQRAGSASGMLLMSRYVGSIPATLVLALAVADNGSGARAYLLVAAAVVALSVAAATRFPARPPEVDGLAAG